MDDMDEVEVVNMEDLEEGEVQVINMDDLEEGEVKVVNMDDLEEGEVQVVNMDDTEVVMLPSDDDDDNDDVVVLPQDEEEEEEDPPPIYDAIDNVISSSSPFIKYTQLETRLHHSTNLTDSPLNSVTFEDCHSLSEFYENAKNKREYPLSGLGSSITLAPKRFDVDDATKVHGNVTKFWYLCLRLVTKFGHQITSLEVKIFNGVEFPTMFWTVLNKILRFTPNLRSLFIEASFKAFSLPSGGGGNMLLPQLNSIDGVKCPGNLNLSSLSVRFVETNILTKLMTSKLLEAYGARLRKLSVTHVTFDMIDKKSLEKLANLKEFNLFWWRSLGGNQGGGGNNQLESVRNNVLNKLEGMKAPGLETLRVMLNNTGFETVREVAYLFKLLGRFPRLQVLNLSGMQLEEGKGEEKMQGNEVLECLKLKDRREGGYDFLGKLEGLQALFIEGAEEYWLMEEKEEEGKGEEKEDKRIIKLREYLYGNQVFKSNIWEKIPRLRVIGVQCQLAPGGEEGRELGGDGGVDEVEETEEICTREMYETGGGDEQDFF